MLRFAWIRGESGVLHPAHWEGLSGTPFQSHEWQSAWWRSFGGRGEPLGLKIFQGHEPIAYWTFIRTGGVCQSLVPMGTKGSDYLHPLTATGSNPWPAIEEALLNPPEGDLIHLQRLREDLTPLPILERETCLVLELPESYEKYEKGLSKSLVTDIRRGKNLKITESEDSLEILFSLHRKRWRKRGWPGAFLPKAAEFHRNLNVQRSIFTIWNDAHPIGALYALHGNGATYFYQSGFDPDFSKLSPGSLLISHAIQRSFERGDRFFDFLRGDEPYKRRWKPTHEYQNGEVFLPLTAKGQSFIKGLTAMGELTQMAKENFEGRSLMGGLAKMIMPKAS